MLYELHHLPKELYGEDELGVWAKISYSLQKLRKCPVRQNSRL